MEIVTTFGVCKFPWKVHRKWSFFFCFFCFCRYTGMPSALRIFTSGVLDWKYRRRMKKMSWNRENWERQKVEKMKKDKEIEDILWINWVLSARSSRPESWRRRATLPGRYDLKVGSTVLLSWERKRSMYSLCLLSNGGIDFSFSSTSFQTGLFINGNKVMSYLKEHGESGIHSSLFKGSSVQTAQHVWYTWSVMVPSCHPPCCPPLNHFKLVY